MLVFLYIPFVENIKNSFFDMASVVKMSGQEFDFIGLDNYKRLFTDPYGSVGNSGETGSSYFATDCRKFKLCHHCNDWIYADHRWQPLLYLVFSGLITICLYRKL